MADDKLAKVGTTALAVPTGMEDMITVDRPEGKDEGLLGNEGITREDVLIPRIGLAQMMSPEIDNTNTQRYIEGLKFTDFFHSVEKTSLGQGPIFFCIIRRDDPRWVEFNPLDQGGGVKDRNVPVGDPRTAFGPHGEKPVATMFYDYLVLVLNRFTVADPMQSFMALSLKSSGIKAAKNLNMMIQQRAASGKKMFKGVYQMTSGNEVDKKSGGKYATYKFKNNGWLQPGSPIELFAAEMFEAWKEREANIDRDATEDDPDTFDPATIEGTARQTDM